MIYDRTIEDVDEAVRIVNERVKRFLPLTASEWDKLERGLMTVDTINRIESKQAEIRNSLNKNGYYNNVGLNKSWELNGYFMQEDLDRLARNTEMLRNSIKVYIDTPNAPKPIYHFEEINKMEKILVDLEKIATSIKLKYKRCNTFNCGEAV